MTDAYADWSKRENTIYIRNYNAAEGIQEKVKLAFLEGMNSDGSDLRFSSVDGTPIKYYIESLENNIFTVWLKLPANQYYIYFYYGNPDAQSESSGKDVFEFFDDMGEENTTDWNYVGDHAYSDSTVRIGGSSNSYIQSKTTYDYNRVVEIKAKHPKGNNCILGFHNISNGYMAAWCGGLGTNVDEYNVNVNSAGSSTISDERDRSGDTTHIYTIHYFEIGVEYHVDNYYRRTIANNIPPSPMPIVLLSEGGKGDVTIEWARVRLRPSVIPELYPVYDLEKLDPVAIDIQKSIHNAYTQVSAKFDTDLVPPKHSRVIYYANASDAWNYLMFFGRVDSNTKTLSYDGNSVDMSAADDMKSLVDLKVPVHYCMREYDTALTEEGSQILFMMWTLITPQTNLNLSYHDDPVLPSKLFKFEFSNTKYEVLQKLLEYFGCLAYPRYGVDTVNGPNEAIHIRLPEEIDADPGFFLPDPIEFTWPDPRIADNPVIERNSDENYNRVRVHGTITSSGATTVVTACTPDCIPKPDDYIETANETAINDNYIEERASTAGNEAIKHLLYYQSNRATVKFRMVDTAGIELYQRVRFGAGFPAELQALTNQKQFEYVCVNDHSTSDDYIDYHFVDVSGVPRPSWLRVVSIHYHVAENEKYMDIEAVTDFIYSSIDPVIPAPYNAYLNPGLMKPSTGDTVGTIKTMINGVVNARPIPEYGWVTVVAADGLSATVLTDSGKTITVKTCAASTVNKRVLVVPDTKGNYYISTYA
jgi:hypothetical protein